SGPGWIIFEGFARAGAYELSVVAPELIGPLATVPNVVVIAGEAVHDSRLVIDLRFRVRAVTVTVDCTDCPFSDAVGWRETKGVFTRISSGRSPSGKPAIPVLIVDRQAVNLVVACASMRTVHLEGLMDDREIRPRPGPDVKAVIDGLPEDLTEGVEIWATPM